MARINYIEVPVKQVAVARDFYGKAFGWTFTDYGPEYAAKEEGEVALGLNGTSDQAIAQVLALIEVEDLEGALESVVTAGGSVTVPIFSFPGGRRFHFRDPDGNELGAFVSEADAPGS
ncbi:MAG: VOC family protein [Sphingomonadales bacterium]|nr:MAG: VOC family protein [Sphingomonadales bacterium]